MEKRRKTPSTHFLSCLRFFFSIGFISNIFPSIALLCVWVLCHFYYYFQSYITLLLVFNILNFCHFFLEQGKGKLFTTRIFLLRLFFSFSLHLTPLIYTTSNPAFLSRQSFLFIAGVPFSIWKILFYCTSKAKPLKEPSY